MWNDSKHWDICFPYGFFDVSSDSNLQRFWNLLYPYTYNLDFSFHVWNHVPGNVAVKMLKRFSLRRAFFCVLFCGCLLVAVSVFQKWSWYPQPDQHFQQFDIATITPLPQDRKYQTTKKIKNDSPKKNWYFSGGTIYPSKTKGPLKLFPDQDAGTRIEEQLMYLPEDYDGKFNPIILGTRFSI